MSLCKELECAIARFWWWGNKDKYGMYWIPWEKMKRRKKFRGLKFRDLVSFNLGYLAKIGWRILHNPVDGLHGVERYYSRKKDSGERHEMEGW